MVKNEDPQVKKKSLAGKEETGSSSKNLVQKSEHNASRKKISIGANREETKTSSTGIHYKKSPHRKRTGDEIEEFKSEYSTQAHILSPTELEEFYETSLMTGLTQARADKLLVENGPNCLIGTPPRSRVWLLLEFLFGGFATLLWIGAVLSLVGFAMAYTHDLKTHSVTNSSYDQMCLGIVIIVVILVTGVFGFYQEARNAAILDSFQKMSPKFATVIRDGEKKNIPCEEIVLGDLIVLEAGMWIPADVRLFEAQGLKVDNSAITGESLPQSRGAELTHNNPIETANIAFYTCCVVEGAGKGIAINCGDHTLLGHIAGLTSALQKGQTPIRREINYFIKIITIISLLTGITFFVISMAVGFDFFNSFSFFIALVVANVPEGLPVTLTACMTLTAKRMAHKNCLVKKLEAIETLGCCNVICSDKTGTLTQNKMTVTHVYYDAGLHDVLHDLDAVSLQDSSFQVLSRVAALCSRAKFVPETAHLPVDQREVIGDASETAILKFMEKKLGNVEAMRTRHPKLAEIPFNSANKYQVSVHALPNQRYVVLMKGAPERVLEKCSTYLFNNQTQSFDDLRMKIAKKAVTHLGAKGERVLAFADMELDAEKYPPGYEFNADNQNFPLEHLRFTGLISLIDPPRATVPDAVAKCRSAGIRVIMVTGDHPVTAAAIAKEVGILSENSTTMYDIALRRDVSISMVTEQEKLGCTAAVITGQDLRDMAEGQLEAAIEQFDEIVFARTSPQQKLKIVEAFQKSGMVVAVTGDGVNDSPALKKADIGIAMGITGSDVSKEAADMILMDDNFSSIVTGVEEGRLIFDNLKKSIAYLLTSNVPEILPFVAMTMLNTPPVCSVIAVIIIDVGTDLWPAISLAYEKAEADIMLRKPRNPKFDKLVNKRLIFLTYAQIGVMQSFASFAAYLHLMTNAGFLWYNLGSRRMNWLNESIDVTDDFGRVWSFEERMMLTRKSYSAYFLAIVLTQIFDLFICKTRRLSLFQQGMRNWVMNLGVLFEIALGLFVVFCPKVQNFFQFEPISMIHLLPAVPYAVGILVFDELRKLCIRRYPSGIVYKETYY